MKDYKSIIDRLDTEKICRYLTNMRWQILPDLLGGKIKQFQSENDDEVVLVPLSKDFTDYYREVKETLDIIAHVEKKTFEEFLTPKRCVLNFLIISLDRRK